MIADILADIVPDKGQGANMTTRAEQRRLPVGLTPRLLSRSAAAAYLGMSENHFDEHVAKVVPPLRFGRRNFWDIKRLDTWLDQQSGLAQGVDTRPIVERLNGGNQGARRKSL
jgi:hypothetical protein